MLRVKKYNKDLKGHGNASYGNIPKVKDFGYFTINNKNANEESSIDKLEIIDDL